MIQSRLRVNLKEVAVAFHGGGGDCPYWCYRFPPAESWVELFVGRWEVEAVSLPWKS